MRLRVLDAGVAAEAVQTVHVLPVPETSATDGAVGGEAGGPGWQAALPALGLGILVLALAVVGAGVALVLLRRKH